MFDVDIAQDKFDETRAVLGPGIGNGKLGISPPGFGIGCKVAGGFDHPTIDPQGKRCIGMLQNRPAEHRQIGKLSDRVKTLMVGLDA